jgi:hypothetical protein
MIKVVSGNLLEAQVEALVNTVNTEGVMGKGIALQFRHGQELKLKYEAQQYGPYARNLRRVLIKLEGHMLRGYGDGDGHPLMQTRRRVCTASPSPLGACRVFARPSSDRW